MSQYIHMPDSLDAVALASQVNGALLPTELSQETVERGTKTLLSEQSPNPKQLQWLSKTKTA